MAKGRFFTVTVLGWEKHNGKKKRGHQYIMISTRIFDDVKFSSLSNGDKLAFIWLLCRCGDELKSTISFHEVALRSAISNLKVPLKSLRRLQELRLVTLEKSKPLDTSQDITRHHKTRKEEYSSELQTHPSSPTKPLPENNASLALVQSTARQSSSFSKIFIIEKVEKFQEIIPDKNWENWLKLYEKNYLQQELIKATSWLLANPAKNRRTRRGLMKFLNNWFNRGWDDWQKRLPSSHQHRSSFTGVADV